MGSLLLLPVGGPGSGKGTQCAKLVEEFGYTHISTGDLMRVEMKKVSLTVASCLAASCSHHLTDVLKLSPFAQGSREGDRIRKIVTEGGLVPFELTVQVLINALIANPSQVSNENFKYYNLHCDTSCN